MQFVYRVFFIPEGNKSPIVQYAQKAGHLVQYGLILTRSLNVSRETLTLDVVPVLLTYVIRRDRSGHTIPAHRLLVLVAIVNTGGSWSTVFNADAGGARMPRWKVRTGTGLIVSRETWGKRL